ncbi:MAG: proton-conducting transporter membrane subunit [Anaerolineales bacterium]|nr:proton-conducting transporter membrane subunit [Anaerolineales bacterium]
MTSYWLLPPLLLPLAGVPLTLALRKYPRSQQIAALLVMFAALLSTLTLLRQVLRHTALTLQLGAWPFPFGISLTADLPGTFMLTMSHLVLMAGFLYAAGSTEKVTRYPTFYTLFFALAAGLSGAFLTGDLFNLFVFAEIIVISGAALTANADEPAGVEAAYKYFYISTLAGMFFLLGVGALYAAYGTLNLADLARQIASAPLSPLTLAGLAFLAVTFFIKSAAVPFHFWQPDFHAAAPTAISAMLSSLVVKVGVYGFLRLTTLLFPTVSLLKTLLVLVGIAGVVYGGFGAAGTHNAKRMLAYSTLAQIGFILVGLGWGTPFSIAAALVFAFNHALIKAAMLMLAGAMASRAAVKSASFSVVVGVGKYHPFAGILFLLGGMALAGIPPLNGFVSKFLIFWSGLDSANYLSLAVLGLASILTVTYVIRAFMRIWFETNPEAKPKAGDSLLAPALLIALSLVLGIWADPLIVLAQTSAQWLNDPQNYIRWVIGSG